MCGIARGDKDKTEKQCLFGSPEEQGREEGQHRELAGVEHQSKLLSDRTAAGFRYAPLHFSVHCLHLLPWLSQQGTPPRPLMAVLLQL